MDMLMLMVGWYTWREFEFVKMSKKKLGNDISCWDDRLTQQERRTQFGGNYWLSLYKYSTWCFKEFLVWGTSGHCRRTRFKIRKHSVFIFFYRLPLGCSLIWCMKSVLENTKHLSFQIPYLFTWQQIDQARDHWVSMGKSKASRTQFIPLAEFEKLPTAQVWFQYPCSLCFSFWIWHIE